VKYHNDRIVSSVNPSPRKIVIEVPARLWSVVISLYRRKNCVLAIGLRHSA